MSTPTTTPTAGAAPAPSTRPAGQTPLHAQEGKIAPRVRIGDTVLVHIDVNLQRPLIVSQAAMVAIPARINVTAGEDPTAPLKTEFRVSGTIFAEPEDHTRPGFRGWAAGGADPARISGRPDRLLPLGYGECLAFGTAVGQWTTRQMGGR